MQFAKDSFFLALQTRLAALNPTRKVTLNGSTVPAIVVLENLPPICAEPQPNTFYIRWERAGVVGGAAGSGILVSMDVLISYYTDGSVASMVDRGRLLAQLDEELLAICQPSNTEKCDYTQSPSADMGTRVVWNQPSFGEVKAGGSLDDGERHQDGRVEREATLTIYFFSEVTPS